MSLLNVENIRKSYGKTEVLKDISFSLKKGEVLAIIGSSGSGKTTLLRCLNFLETPGNGKISVNDKVLFDSNDSSAKSDSEIRKRRLHFGLVFQSFNLFPQYTVIENIMLAPKLAAKEQIKQTGEYMGAKSYKEALEIIKSNAKSLLERVGLSEKSESYPCNLSGGQQQRVAIARAYAVKPEVLLMDEPFGALDAQTRTQLQTELLKTETRWKWMKSLSDTANGTITGKARIMLETYIQMQYFDRILARANIRLMTMSSGQYELVRRKENKSRVGKTGLELDVVDHYNGTVRSVKTLSGGETFQASLSLALGLSDEIQSSSGGIQLDTMFVDEGFGSLDEDALDQAIRALKDLSQGSRLVGIVSHVAELKERIDKKIIVTKKRTEDGVGSTICIEG